MAVKAAPIGLGGIPFPTKTAAEVRIQHILNTSPLGRIEGKEFDIIRDLLNLHPDAQKKIGVGVESIEIRVNPTIGQKGRGFWIVRVDGSETDFSYKKCLAGDAAARTKFIRACRHAVSLHIEEYRSRFFAHAVVAHCPLTGEVLSRVNAHVDHAPPFTFDRIVNAFVELNGIDPNDPALCVSGEDGLLVPTFTDPVLRDRFVQFHNTNAQLRVVSANANLRVVPKHVAKPGSAA